MSPPRGIRLPGYVQGHTGIVERIQPAAVFPDTNALLQGEDPQYVYAVRLDSRELWDADIDDKALWTHHGDRPDVLLHPRRLIGKPTPGKELH